MGSSMLAPGVGRPPPGGAGRAGGDSGGGRTARALRSRPRERHRGGAWGAPRVRSGRAIVGPLPGAATDLLGWRCNAPIDRSSPPCGGPMPSPSALARFVRWMAIPAAALGVGGALVAGACASREAARPAPAAAGAPAPEPRRERVAAAPLERRVRISDTLAEADPEVLRFMQHIVTLSDPFFEGRSADTKGNRRAADYIESHLARLGLAPVFATDASTVASSFRQPLTVPGDVSVERAALAWRHGPSEATLVEGTDFNALGFSGSGQARGPCVFVGYSVPEGPEGYHSYPTDPDLTGKIAVMLRWEPMDEQGRSRWSGNAQWSRHAGLVEKVGAAVERGAAGVIVINPPGTSTPRDEALATPRETRFGAPAGVPVVMMSQDAAERFLRAADPQGRSLMDLRRVADESGRIVGLREEVEVAIEVEMERERLGTDNVGAVLRGRGALADRFIIIGAHYDHVGYGFVGGARPANVGALHPGADDNASGTAAILKLARALAASPNRPKRSILFNFVTAEEYGLLGSKY
ncbi:MAG TPA: hypothetical protein DEB06_04860, partial [Phycisphaerales bacterium]|nr:hypothetical protein [Phycisphaerales bacterium]